MLEIKSLSVAYDDYPVLEDVTLNVEAGEIVAVIGPNGAGKSTLIRAVSGALPSDAGSIRIDGQDILHLSETQRARCLAVVPQARVLPGAFTAYQTVLLGRTPYLGWLGHAGPSDHDRVQLALEQTHSLGLAERRVGTLSGGEQQRILLARALAQDTLVLLLDEPTTHLDLQHQYNFLNLVRKLTSKKNLAVLMVLHDLNLTGLYADRVMLLANGSMRVIGSPDKVLTEENLNTAYNTNIHVIPHPEFGIPLILPGGQKMEPHIWKPD